MYFRNIDPSIYAVGWYNNVYGVYASFDAGTTWAAIDVPAYHQVWPGNSVDLITWITGDHERLWTYVCRFPEFRRHPHRYARCLPSGNFL
jgi:hypothetical protein